MLNSHPGRQQYRWFQNFLNPDGAGMTKETPQEGRYVRVEVEGTFTGIFDVHRTTRTYREAFGYLDESSTTLLYDPSKTELMMGDHVLPWGKGQNGADVSHMVSPQSIIRGHQRSTGAGRVSTSGTTLTCTENHGLVVSDVVWILESSYIVVAVPSRTTATLHASAGTTTGLTWELGRDWIDPIYPVKVIASYIPTLADSAVYGRETLPPIELRYTDGVLGTIKGERRYFVRWQAPLRLPVGTAYSLNVGHLPLYRVAEGGISIPGLDYDSIYEQLKGKVVSSPASLPKLATLTLVVR
jgi:hypothetical protein